MSAVPKPERTAQHRLDDIVCARIQAAIIECKESADGFLDASFLKAAIARANSKACTLRAEMLHFIDKHIEQIQSAIECGELEPRANIVEAMNRRLRDAVEEGRDTSDHRKLIAENTRKWLSENPNLKLSMPPVDMEDDGG